MKKFLRYFVVIAVLLVLVVYVGLQFFLGSIIKKGVNEFGPKMTQTTVQLADASVSPLSGAGTLKGLTVGNPKGWSDAKLLSVGEVHFDVEPTSLLHETIIINDLTVDQSQFSYETHFVSSNVGDLMKNIEAAVGAKAEPTDKNAKQHKFIVKHFRLNDAKVTVGVGAAAIPLTVPPVELTDLGVAEGGLTSSQLAVAVMREVTPNIIAATTDAASKLGGTMGAAASDAVKKAGQGLQKFLGGKK